MLAARLPPTVVDEMLTLLSINLSRTQDGMAAARTVAAAEHVAPSESLLHRVLQARDSLGVGAGLAEWTLAHVQVRRLLVRVPQIRKRTVCVFVCSFMFCCVDFAPYVADAHCTHVKSTPG